MRTPVLVVGLLGLCSALGVGCTHTQLRYNTVRQAATLDDLYRQQVLENLAMFAHDPYALPFFLTADTGRSDVNDRGTASTGIDWGRLGFTGVGLDLEGQRFWTELWNLNPTKDPRRLELMRCAYQQVVGVVPADCPDCCLRYNEFYSGDPMGNAATDRRQAGIIHVGCLSSCWFVVTTDKHDLPDGCDCDEAFVGEYCGTYVYVPPSARDELTKLTLVILDFATGVPPVPSSPSPAEVVEYFSPDFVPTNPSNASIVVKTLRNPKELQEAAKQRRKQALERLNKRLRELELPPLPAPEGVPTPQGLRNLMQEPKVRAQLQDPNSELRSLIEAARAQDEPLPLPPETQPMYYPPRLHLFQEPGTLLQLQRQQLLLDSLAPDRPFD